MKAEHLIPFVEQMDTYKRYGRIKRVVGLMIESQGPESSIGDVCYIHVGAKNQKKLILRQDYFQVLRNNYCKRAYICGIIRKTML